MESTLSVLSKICICTLCIKYMHAVHIIYARCAYWWTQLYMCYALICYRKFIVQSAYALFVKSALWVHIIMHYAYRVHCAYALNVHCAYALNAQCVYSFNVECAYAFNAQYANLLHTLLLPKYMESTLRVLSKLCGYKICTLSALNQIIIQYICPIHSCAAVNSLCRA